MDDISALRPYFIDNKCRICDCTIGGTFIWRDYHKTEYAVEDGVLFLKVAFPEPAFTPPRGANINKGSYERIIRYCDVEGIKPQLCAVSGPVLQSIREMFPDIKLRTDRAWSDYLYESSDLVSLAGRKFSGQRNHINRFMREYPSWSFRKITDENIKKTREFYEKYAREHMKDSPAYIEGDKKALEALDNFEAYRLLGGALYIDEKIVGVSFGEIVDDTIFVHAEKADTEYHGSYPMLSHQFVKMFVTEGIKYVNREEDDGIEGLRTSKLSYHPIELLHKYMVEL